MGPDSAIAVIAAAIALGALAINWKVMRIAAGALSAAHEQVKAAKDQVSIARQVWIDTHQPYVWVDIRPDDAQGTLINLCIGNSGPTVATDVRVEITPPLPSIESFEKGVGAAQAMLARGLPALAPGRTYEWAMGQGFNLLQDDQIADYEIKIDFSGPLGDRMTSNYTINTGTIAEALDKPRGSLYQLTRAVKDLKDSVDKLRR